VSHRGRLIVRAPNHLGEAVLALPALEAAAAGEGPGGLVVQVVAELVPLLRMSGIDAEVLSLSRRQSLLPAAREVRRSRAKRGVLLTPAISAALIFRAARLAMRRGTSVRGRDWLLTDRVDRGPLLEGHRVREYLRLVAPRRELGAEIPRPRLGDPSGAVAAWKRLAARLHMVPGEDASGPRIGLFPGGRAPARRWPPERFADLARRLVDRGAEVFVWGGAAERALTRRVVEVAGSGWGSANRGRIHDLGGRTTLEELAGGLRSSDLLVTNDSGPMHLAAALGRAVVALEGPADLRQTRPLAERVRMVGHFDLVCVPCNRRTCPRSGRGDRLPAGRDECMRLIRVAEVERAVWSLLEEGNERRE